MTAMIFGIVNVAKGCKSQSQPEPKLPLNSAILRVINMNWNMISMNPKTKVCGKLRSNSNPKRAIIVEMKAGKKIKMNLLSLVVIQIQKMNKVVLELLVLVDRMVLSI